MYATVKDFRTGATVGNYELKKAQDGSHYWQNRLSDGILSLGGYQSLFQDTEAEAIRAAREFYGDRITFYR